VVVAVVGDQDPTQPPDAEPFALAMDECEALARRSVVDQRFRRLAQDLVLHVQAPDLALLLAKFGVQVSDGGYQVVAGAVGAFGGVLVNLAFRESFLSYHSATGVYVEFIVAFLVCGVVMRFLYQCREVAVAIQVPESASA
jgi:nitrate/nitrite transporter NarK